MPTYRQNELRWVGKLPVLVVATVFTYGQLTICIIATPAKGTSKHVGKLPAEVSYHGGGGWLLQASCYHLGSHFLLASRPEMPISFAAMFYARSNKTNGKLLQPFLPTLNQLLSTLLGCH